MTGEHIAIATALAEVLARVGAWPIGLILLLVVICPWLALFLVSRSLERRAADHDKQSVITVATLKEQFSATLEAHNQRFEEVVRMYEDNVLLVRGYEKLANDLTSVIHLNIQVQTRLVEKIDNNMYCPAIREKGPRG